MLNILPAEYKTALQRDWLEHQLRRLSIVMIITALVVSTIVLLTEQLLQRWQASLPSHSSIAQLDDAERQDLETLITNLQQAVGAVQATANSWHHPLIEVAELLRDVPATIRLHSLTINYTTKHIELTGTAADRESLVSYQQQLSQYNILQNVSFPLSAFGQKELIPFSAEADLRL